MDRSLILDAFTKNRRGLTRRSFGHKLSCASFAPHSLNVGADKAGALLIRRQSADRLNNKGKCRGIVIRNLSPKKQFEKSSLFIPFPLITKNIIEKQQKESAPTRRMSNRFAYEIVYNYRSLRQQSNRTEVPLGLRSSASFGYSSKLIRR